MEGDDSTGGFIEVFRRVNVVSFHAITFLRGTDTVLSDLMIRIAKFLRAQFSSPLSTIDSEIVKDPHSLGSHYG